MNDTVFNNIQVNLLSAVDPAFIKSAAGRRVVVPEKTFAERVCVASK